MNSVNAAWVGVDWGTTHLRAFIMDADDNLIDQISSNKGMSSLEPDDYERTLLGLLHPWLNERRCLPVYACGMVGSKQGWQETPYRTVPTSPIFGEDLVSIETDSQQISVWVLPGLSQSDRADVMRGEETQLAGLLLAEPSYSGCVCLPGTHSKWVILENGEVLAFHTYLTGELFSILSQYSVLKHSVQTQSFDTYVCVAAASAVVEKRMSLTNSLFSVRAEDLLHDVAASSSRAALSGLLIGEELADTETLWAGESVTIIGETQLTQLYVACLQAQGGSVQIMDSTDATVAGLKLAKQQHQGQTP